MNRPGHNNVSIFVGKEVEHSPAYGLQTLFVVGVQPIEIIEAAYIAYKCTHIYFGANQSFAPDGTADYFTSWDEMILYFLHKEIWCTLDFDVADVESVLESGFVEYNTFIPMISVKVPYINQLGYNAVLKIDDKDFKATNPGVWCHSLHSLMKRDMIFTDWSKYTQDTVIK